MKVLVVAYEYPPSPSPQSLRWAYLARELAALGNEVHVMAPDAHYGRMGLDFESPLVRVHKVFAGPGMGLVVRAARMKRRFAAPPAGGAPRVPDSAGARVVEQKLNWKGRLLKAYHRFAGALLFPDIRSEWTPWARHALRRLLHETKPDVVITSHEPASTLPLGMMAKRLGFPWVADLGDPVLADYTPARHHARAERMEERTCMTADAVVVTDERARDVLVRRHARASAAIDVVTQGYSSRKGERQAHGAPAMPGLNLAYTGSVYTFRPIDPLLEAVTASEGVTLQVAAAKMPASLRDAGEREPSRFVLHGHMSHENAMSLQQHADVVVNIGNRLEAQVPGKLYEYFSSGRPILHLQSWESDAGADLVERLGRGWVVANEASAIQVMLGDLARRKAEGKLLEGIDVSEGAVEQYRWDRLAQKYEAILGRVTAARNPVRMQ